MKKIILSTALVLGLSVTASLVYAQTKTTETCCKKDEKKEKSCCSENGDKGSCEKEGKSKKAKKSKKKAQ